MKYTNEQIRGAILRAADRIEGGAPYNFMVGYINKHGENADGCGCMLHYVGIELGMREVGARQVAKEIGLSDAEMAGYHDIELYAFADDRHLNMYKASDAPTILRQFADHKFPALSTPIVAEDRQLVRWDQCAWKPAGVRA